MANVDYNELREALAIEKHRLDDEIEQQAGIYYMVAEEAVFAKSRLDAADEDVKLVQAELDPLMREAMEADGTKITEAVVRAAVIQHKRSKAAVERARECREVYERLVALKDAFRQRASMLRDLVELHVTGYFTVTSVKGSKNRNDESRAETVRKRLNELRRSDKGEERVKAKRRGED